MEDLPVKWFRVVEEFKNGIEFFSVALEGTVWLLEHL